MIFAYLGAYANSRSGMPQVHTFTLSPLLRKGKDPQQNQRPIFLRITVDGKPTEVSTKQSVDPLQWNQQKGRVRGNMEWL